MKANERCFFSCDSEGFTLVELMIVVCVIGLLAAIAIPSFRKSRAMTQVAVVSNDIRILGDAFNQYSIEYGGYPPAVFPYDVLPPGVADYIDNLSTWIEPPQCGGSYVWYGDVMPGGISLGIWGLTSPNMADGVDEYMDNGNPASGRVELFAAKTGILYFLEKD